jgi:hypothetical protein
VLCQAFLSPSTSHHSPKIMSSVSSSTWAIIISGSDVMWFLISHHQKPSSLLTARPWAAHCLSQPQIKSSQKDKESPLFHTSEEKRIACTWRLRHKSRPCSRQVLSPSGDHDLMKFVLPHHFYIRWLENHQHWPQLMNFSLPTSISTQLLYN